MNYNTLIRKLLFAALMYAATPEQVIIANTDDNTIGSEMIDWEKYLSETGDNFDINSIESMLGLESNDYDAKVDFDGIPLAATTRNISDDEIGGVLALLEPIEILKEEFFKATNPLGPRQLVDQPSFFEHPKQYSLSCYDHHMAISLFGYKANEYDFRKDSIRRNDRISSYLALEEDTLIEKIQTGVEQVGLLLDNEFRLDIRKIFNLFKNMRIEERKVGAVFDYYRTFSEWRMRALFPFYFFERNFYLTEEEQVEIEKEFGQTTEEEQEKFRKEHAISDKLGFGDTRLEFDKCLYAIDYATLYGGIQFTVPTAFTVGKNFFGSTFEQKSTFPIIDLDELFLLACEPTEKNKEKAFDIVANLVLEASDRIAANLIDAKLGNNGHLGLGLFLRGRGNFSWLFPWRWVENIVFTNRISLEYLTPAYETRSYINTINREQLDAIDFEEFVDANPLGALDFVKEQLIKKLYLRGFRTLVQPGVIFRWTSKGTYQCEKWGLSAGTDFFVQSKEGFLSIDAPDSIQHNLDIKKAKMPLLWQTKLHARLIRNYKREYSQLNAWIGVDGNIGRQGLANDFGISVGVDWTF